MQYQDSVTAITLTIHSNSAYFLSITLNLFNTSIQIFRYKATIQQQMD